MKELQIALSLKGQFTSMKQNRYLNLQVIDQVSSRRTRQHHWRNSLNPDLHRRILEIDIEAEAIIAIRYQERCVLAYTNTSYDYPIEHRYKDAAAVCKLKGLKRRWNPKGFFTKELL